MALVIVALVLSILFIVAGMLVMEYSSGMDGILPFVFVVMPAAAGLALAVVSLVIHLIPATNGWAWLPATLSCGATASMFVYAGAASLLSRLFWRD